MKYIDYTWEDFELDIIHVEHYLKYSCPVKRFDLVCGIACGGNNFMGKLRGRLGLPYDVIKAASYRNEKRGELLAEIPGSIKRDFSNSNILVVDDICDSGRTMEYIIGEISQYAKPFAMTLFHKDSSIFKPDYYVRKAEEDNWIRFCWE